MMRATIPPEIMDSKGRTKMGLPEDPARRGDYLVELNLRNEGGAEESERRFLHLFAAVTGRKTRPIRVGKSYYACSLTLREVVELVRRDELPDGALPVAAKEPQAGLPAKNLPRHRAIHRVWPDFPVRALMDRSVATVKADAAQRAFAASGHGIVWAVLDSGIDASHPHFGLPEDKEGRTLYGGEVELFHRDFQNRSLGDPESLAAAKDPEILAAYLNAHRESALSDPYGHGTHVAGVIAGGCPCPPLGSPATTDLRVFQRAFSEVPGGSGHTETVEERTKTVDPHDLHGVAPKCKLISLRVLDDFGTGRSSDVIRALDYIRERLNHDPRLPRVHGVNLSVGYEFDAEMYACGQSPLCIEVDRLVRTGVVVVAAAGNTGYGTVLANERTTQGSLTQTINDPGNAALAITVGATHRDSPYTYGVSYFSSKGPTGDGRLKPDLVAPGERMTSCASGHMRERIPGLPPPANPEGSLPPAIYLDLSGTSMAAPHVSGAIAAFLSIRREFIGKPLEVKKIFLDTASPLGRERYFEGHGLLDLMRAIQSV
jgi:subtilisin family serine protease